jgi:DNA-binding Lrp family transcriptional regulator
MSGTQEADMIKGYILIQTQVGRAHEVAGDVARIKGVLAAEGVTGPYDVIVEAEASGLDELSKLVVMRIQEVDGVTRTLTCPVVHL